MKTALRILFFIIAIFVGGLLGYYLLAGLDLLKILLLGASSVLLGHVFHAVDKKVMGIK